MSQEKNKVLATTQHLLSTPARRYSAIAGVVARVAGQRASVPVVYTVHGFGFKPEVPLLRRTVASMAERMLARWTTQMICVSKHERELAYDLPIAPERVHVIANGLARLLAAPRSTDRKSVV